MSMTMDIVFVVLIVLLGFAVLGWQRCFYSLQEELFGRKILLQQLTFYRERLNLVWDQIDSLYQRKYHDPNRIDHDPFLPPR